MKKRRAAVPDAHLRTPSLRELLRRLRRHEPLCAPVRVAYRAGVRSDGEWVLGYAGWRRNWRSKRVTRFNIVIDSRLPRGEQWEVLIHEWAHCMDVRWPRPRDCHDARWGQCFARAFRASIKPVRGIA